MAPKPPVSVFQARYAALTRDRAADDPELIAAHRDFVYARLQVHIADITADPSLTERQQQEKIARKKRIAENIAGHPLSEERMQKVAAMLKAGTGAREAS